MLYKSTIIPESLHPPQKYAQNHHYMEQDDGREDIEVGLLHGLMAPDYRAHYTTRPTPQKSDP